MWHSDEYDEIDKLFNRALLDASAFPVTCPCCGSVSGHIYMNKHKEFRGGIWTWCSNCKSCSHMSGWIPIWWENAPFIDENELCGIPDYLDSRSREIDDWVSGLLKSDEVATIRKRLEEDGEFVICEMCGTEMIPFSEDYSYGMTCPKCGWGWVTSHFEQIDLDTTDYQVVLQPGNEVKGDVLREISNILGVNYIQAKRIIENTPVTIYKGKARDVVVIIDKLDKKGIKYAVQPDFPYIESKSGQ